MVKTSSQPLTLEAFLQLPETKPASEYIDGKTTQKPMPQEKHSVIQTELATKLNANLKSRKIARAFSELRCTFGGRSTVPDVSVLVWDRIPRDKDGSIANRFLLPPDWMIEILSPEQSAVRVTQNILHCLDHQTQMGWLIDPAEQAILVYLPAQQPACFDEADRQLPVPSFAKSLQLTVGEIFGWLV